MSDIVCLSINCKFELVSIVHFLNVAGSCICLFIHLPPALLNVIFFSGDGFEPLYFLCSLTSL